MTKTVFVISVSSLPWTLTVLLKIQLICTHVKNVSLTLRFLKIGSMKYTDYLHLLKCINYLLVRLQTWKQILIQCKLFHFNLLFFGLLLNIHPQSKSIPLCTLAILTLKMCYCRVSTPAFYKYLQKKPKTKPNPKTFPKNIKAKSLFMFTSTLKPFSISITCPPVDIFQSICIFMSHKKFMLYQRDDPHQECPQILLNILSHTWSSFLDIILQLQ